MKPPADGMVLRAWTWDLSRDHVLRTLSAFWDAYAPLSPRATYFWNGTVLAPDRMLFWGLVIAAVVAVCLAASWRALIVLLVGQLGVLAFLHAKYFGTVRHHGALFVAAIAAFWIFWAREPRPASPKSQWLGIAKQWAPRTVLIGLLTVQAYAVIVPVYYSLRVPFSPGHAAALSLLKEVKNGEPVVVFDDAYLPSLAAYAPGRTFFLVWGPRWGTFTMYRNYWKYEMDGIGWARKMADERRSSVLLVNPRPLSPLPKGVIELGHYDNGTVTDERYYLYRVEPVGSD